MRLYVCVCVCFSELNQNNKTNQCRQLIIYMHTHTHILIDSALIFQVSKESAGAIDEEDFIKAFTDVPTVQVQYTQGHKCRQSRHSFNLITKLYRSDCLRLFFFSLLPLPSPMQIYSSRDLEDNLNKIREVCSDDKHDWDQRANAVSSHQLSKKLPRFWHSLLASLMFTFFFFIIIF